MEFVLFTVNAIVIYLLSDRIIRFIESRRAEPIKNRRIVFFVVFLPLILISFEFLRTLLIGSA